MNDARHCQKRHSGSYSVSGRHYFCPFCQERRGLAPVPVEPEQVAVVSEAEASTPVVPSVSVAPPAPVDPRLDMDLPPPETVATPLKRGTPKVAGAVRVHKNGSSSG